MNWSQLNELLPIGVVLTASLVVVFLNIVLAPKDRYVLSLVGVAGCLLGLLVLGKNYHALAAQYGQPPAFFHGFFRAAEGTYDPVLLGGAFVVDGFGMSIMAVAMLAGALALLCATPREDDSALSTGEYFGLILLAVAGMMLLAIAHDFLALLIALEVMSVATYILAGSARRDVRSGESALKYLILGAFSTAFLMLGIAFVYGATGSLSMQLPALVQYSPLVKAALALILVGVLFKVGAVPFHSWVPDVYEGAPTGITALMAVGVKAAAFAVVARLCFEAFGMPDLTVSVSAVPLREAWVPLFAVLAVLTMALGNLLAMHQNNVKRMLAYSGIAHSGYLLLAFLVDTKTRPTAIAPEVTMHLQAASFYLLAYGVMTLGAFGVLSLMREDGRPMEKMEDFTGLAKEHPALALCMAVFMLSLAGMPPFAGFFAKFLVFKSAVSSGFAWAAVLGILTSVASLYYYLRVVVRMYMAPAGGEGEPAPARCRYAWTLNLLIYGTGALTLLLGLLPQWLSRLY